VMHIASKIRALFFRFSWGVVTFASATRVQREAFSVFY
jgi:hypothetical protein